MRLKSSGLLIGLTAAAGCIAGTMASAHHSFAVFFDQTNAVTISGTVKSFRFTNPHGTIVLAVTGNNGSVRDYRVETTAPVVLRRRGWSRRSLIAGQKVTIDGWAARDGRPYLRLRAARDENGVAIGAAPFAATDD